MSLVKIITRRFDPIQGLCSSAVPRGSKVQGLATYTYYQGEGHGGETWQKYELWAGVQVAVCNALELELKNQVGHNE